MAIANLCSALMNRQTNKQVNNGDQRMNGWMGGWINKEIKQTNDHPNFLCVRHNSIFMYA